MTDHGQHDQGDAPTYGQIVARWAATVVVEAPERALITLELVRSLDNRALWCNADRLYLGDDQRGEEVIYRVTGWDAEATALVVERVRPDAPSTPNPRT